jgi:hypothetical protein
LAPRAAAVGRTIGNYIDDSLFGAGSRYAP